MVEAVLLNLLAQGLWEFAVSPLASYTTGLFGSQADGAVLPAVSLAATSAVQRLEESGVLNEDTADVEAALARPEVHALLRELYVFNAGSQPDGVGKAREAFDLFWRQAAPELVGSPAMFAGFHNQG